VSRTTTIPRAVPFIAYSSAAAAVVIDAFLLGSDPGRNWLLAATLALTGVGLMVGRVRASRTITSAITELPIVCAVLLLDPALAMLVGVLVGAIPRGGYGMVSRAINSGMLGIPAGLAAASFAATREFTGVMDPADAPIIWFCLALGAVAVDTAAHFSLAAMWTRLHHGLPVREWIVDIGIPYLKNDPVSGVAIVTLVEIGLLLEGTARFLPIALMAVAGFGMWITMHTTRRQVEARDLKDDFFRAIFTSLARLLQMKDTHTALHSARVAVFSRDIARALGLSEEEQSRIHLAGLLHDVGKVGVPDEILLKPGRLTAEERAIMQRHARLSAEAIQGIPGFGDLVRMIYAHHERLDGSGYPEGIRGADLSTGARILGVADTFEALISDRPYRPGRTPLEALEVFDREIELFDPEVVAALRLLVLSGDTLSSAGAVGDFSKEWSRAARHLEVRLDEVPFELPPERPRHPFPITPVDDRPIPAVFDHPMAPVEVTSVR